MTTELPGKELVFAGLGDKFRPNAGLIYFPGVSIMPTTAVAYQYTHTPQAGIPGAVAKGG